MRRTVPSLLLAAVAVSLCMNAMLSVKVQRLERDLVRHERGSERDRPISTSERTPSITFSDEAALADYAVRTNDRLQRLEAALERDIHREPALSESVLVETHFAIDGRRWDLSPASEPYLAFTGPER